MTMRQNNERHARIFFCVSEKNINHTHYILWTKTLFRTDLFSASHLLVRKFITLLVTSKGFKCDV